MARLYDQVMAGELSPPGWTDVGVGPEAIRDLGQAPVFVVDNVARYYYQVSDQDVWTFAGGDFPNLAPPFSLFWLEFRKPSTVNKGGSISRLDGPAKAVGAFVHSERTDDGWKMSLAIVPEVRGFGPVGPIGMVVMSLDREGAYVVEGTPIMTTGHRGVRVAVPDAERLETEDRDVVTTSCVDVAKPLCLAISFMHCKNVKAREVVPPEPLSKKWEKKHGRPQVTYKVLDIDPMKKTLESEGGASTNGLKKALHICRGHFAHYPDGLFNRGEPETVWRPQHVRGSASEGAVVKDYNVKAPG